MYGGSFRSVLALCRIAFRVKWRDGWKKARKLWLHSGGECAVWPSYGLLVVIRGAWTTIAVSGSVGR